MLYLALYVFSWTLALCRPRLKNRFSLYLESRSQSVRLETTLSAFDFSCLSACPTTRRAKVELR